MSIKKKIVALLAAALFVVPAMGLTACGSDGDNSGVNPPASDVGNDENDNVNNGDNDNDESDDDENESGDENEDEDNGELKSEKITSAEAWKAAFDFSVFTNGTVYESILTKTDSKTIFYNCCTYKFDGNVRQLTSEYFEDDTIETEVNYIYFEIHDRMGGFNVFLDEFIATDKNLSERYDEFEYDEINGEYVLEYGEIAEGINNFKITVFISEAKVVRGKYIFNAFDEEANDWISTEVVWELTDIDTTESIVLPNAVFVKD